MPTKPRMLTHDGRTLALSEWAKETGITAETIRSRIDHQGMSVEQALTRPVAAKFNPRSKMLVLPAPCPAARRHKSSGQARACWTDAGGTRQERYFGVWGSRGAAEAYARFQREWYAGRVGVQTRGSHGLQVCDLIDRYLDHAERYYVRDGKPTSELAGQKAAMTYLHAHSDLPVGEAKARHLKDCQAAMVKAKLSRRTINQYTWRIAHCFRWGVGEDLVPPDVAAVLESVPNLQAGRSEAEDTAPVMSVPESVVKKTLPYLDSDPARRAVLVAMIQLLEATGMRPGELCAMTAFAVEKSGKCWCYRAPNKNLHRQARRSPRVVWIGPKGQAILAPFLATPGPGGRVWCFPPKGKAELRTPISRGRLGEIVRLACKAAKVEHWHPHCLRHNRATEVQRLYEDDRAAAAAIGDTADVARLVYADPNDAAARRIALATG